MPDNFFSALALRSLSGALCTLKLSHPPLLSPSPVLTEYAPGSMKEQVLGDYNGRKLAIDASMAIYQFLVAVRSAGEHGGASQQLTNEAGEVTSHLQGLWYRTIKFVEAGIKPVYVFDGKPPTLKNGELAKRKAMKEKAQADLEAAKEAGNAEDIERFSKRTVSMTKEMQEDCKKLLRMMGMPVVEAPCEAEAQCAALARADKVYAAASEDMDTLTFGAPRLVRRLWASEASKTPILEIDLSKVLSGASPGPPRAAPPQRARAALTHTHARPAPALARRHTRALQAWTLPCPSLWTFASCLAATTATPSRAWRR